MCFGTILFSHILRMSISHPTQTNVRRNGKISRLFTIKSRIILSFQGNWRIVEPILTNNSICTSHTRGDIEGLASAFMHT